MPANYNQAKWDTEITYNTASGTGSFLPFSAALQHETKVIIFDNQSNVTVIISDDGVNNGKTFVAGEALVIDCNANKGLKAEEMAWAIGTQFYASSAAGTGNFVIDMVYTK